jgi:hypothetical protein
MEHLETILPAGAIRLSPEILDRIDALVPPGISVNPVMETPSGTTANQMRRPR